MPELTTSQFDQLEDMLREVGDKTPRLFEQYSQWADAMEAHAKIAIGFAGECRPTDALNHLMIVGSEFENMRTEMRRRGDQGGHELRNGYLNLITEVLLRACACTADNARFFVDGEAESRRVQRSDAEGRSKSHG